MADYPTRRGNIVQVALTNDGWTRSTTTTTVHPLTCGEMLSGEVTLERRNGPRRLSDNDDDDESYLDTDIEVLPPASVEAH